MANRFDGADCFTPDELALRLWELQNEVDTSDYTAGDALARTEVSDGVYEFDVQVDGSTVAVNGSNQLYAIGADIIYARVNNAGGTAADTNLYDYDSGVSITGCVTASATGQFRNNNQVLADSQRVILVKRQDTGEYEPEQVGVDADSVAVADIIYARVNNAGGTSADTNLYAYDSGVSITGCATAASTGQFRNNGQVLSDNQRVILVKRADTGEYEPEQVGGVGGSAGISLFRLTADMALSASYGTGKPVDDTGTVVGGATAVRLLNWGNRWHGFGPYTDGDTAAASYEGSLVAAVFVTDDHEGSGVAGWAIVDCEGWADTLSVTLNEDYSASGTGCAITARLGCEGVGRLPRTVSDSDDVTVYDTLGLAANAKDGDKATIAYHADAGRYIFVDTEPVETGYSIRNAVAIIRCFVDAGGVPLSGDVTVPEVRSVNSASNIGARVLKWSDGAGSGRTPDTSVGIAGDGWVDVCNDTTVPFVASPDQPIIVHGILETFGSANPRFTIIHHDLRSHQGWDEDADQSIGHDASNNTPVWQDDLSC